MFPNAAAANQSIYYDRSGNARSVSQVYSALTSRYVAAANSTDTRTAMASVGGDVSGALTVAGAVPPSAIDNAAYLSSFPDARAVTPVSVASAPDRASSGPMFRSLFQAGDHPPDIAGGAGVVGDFPGDSRIREPGTAIRTNARGACSGPSRSLQRPQRLVQQLIRGALAWRRALGHSSKRVSRRCLASPGKS